MYALEKLYESAEKNLDKNNQDWGNFAKEFEQIFGCEMALYRSAPNNEGLTVFSYNDIIVTTDKKTIKQYFDEKIYEYEEILPDPENPFEPARRTDMMSDEEYCSFELAQKYLLPNNVFYLMVVYSLLCDGSALVLFVWRGKGKKDFSDIEKQRLTLFMRYLSTLIKIIDPVKSQEDNENIVIFGKKYNLTDTEISILSSLLQGHSLKQIAHETNRKYGTVRWHVQNILQKCQAKNQKKLLSEFYALIKY